MQTYMLARSPGFHPVFERSPGGDLAVVGCDPFEPWRLLMTRRSVLVCAVLVLAAAACSKKEGGGGGDTSKYPGTEEGAKKMLTDIRTGDAAAMTKALKPTSADYKAVFVDAAAAKAESGYEK